MIEILAYTAPNSDEVVWVTFSLASLAGAFVTALQAADGITQIEVIDRRHNQRTIYDRLPGVSTNWKVSMKKLDKVEIDTYNN